MSVLVHEEVYAGSLIMVDKCSDGLHVYYVKGPRGRLLGNHMSLEVALESARGFADGIEVEQIAHNRRKAK